ncbi:MAG: hypothetical protein LBI99_06130 [Propionibacteriaceae bacterium]|jgi:hypothetical protein|nr:hypothetical protein [Propionibacteriaceae bacterium]
MLPMNPAKIFPAAILAALLIPGCSTTSQITADYFAYGTVDDAVQTAQLIVTGTYLDSREDSIGCPEEPEPGLTEEENPQLGVPAEEITDLGCSPVTISSIKVTSVLKGSAEVGETIEVGQDGGTIDGIRQLEAHTVLLSDVAAKGDLVFLLTDCGPWYCPLNPHVGILTLDGSETTTISKSSENADIKSLAEIEAALRKQQ